MYFLNIIRDRRKRSNIGKFMDEDNNCLEGNDKIAERDIRFYRNLFITTILTLVIAPLIFFIGTSKWEQ